mgnify:FL=1
MEKQLYWAYVSFTEVSGGKTRPVLYLRQTDYDYIVFRLTSKFDNKSDFIKSKYVVILDWQQSGLYKPSCIDTVKTYQLPIDKTKLSYIGQLSSADLVRLIDSIYK